METISSHSPQAQSQQQTAASPSTSSKHFKNWFDEFKAKVSKKSLGSQATNSDQVSISSEDIIKDDTQSTVQNAVSTSSVQAPVTASPAAEASQIKVKSSSLRARKPPKISSADFETNSAVFASSRRDSRHEAAATRKRRQTSIYSKLFAPIRWLVSYLIPFNATLPWKLICLINSCFVIVVIGLASGSSQASTALSFCNGFLSGLFVASISFIILGISFVFHVMPKSQDRSSLMSLISSQSEFDSTTSTKASDHLITRCTDDSNADSLNNTTFVSGRDPGDFSLFEILDHSSTFESPEGRPLETSKLSDENFKGWMIEFIGDYEQRNTSEIKLKSIFVRIEDGVLYLCKPKNSHDVDTTTLPAIANQRVYDLNSVQKFSANLLIPKTVRNKLKYVWSKKYPIKLEFHEPPNEVSSGKVGQEQSPRTVQLTLFAKSCREKEEWFRRFKRIVVDNRFAHGSTTTTRNLNSQKSDETQSNVSNSESLFDSLKRFRRRSPSPKRDCVQTSQSSHLLNDPKRIVDDLIKGKIDREAESSSSSSAASLVRTKSCEIIDPSRPHLSATDVEQNKLATDDDDDDDESARKETGPDDSTLTKETAELFSQAIGYSNFIESQPTLDYNDFIERVIGSSRSATSTSDWFNALTGRIFFDVFSHNHWSLWFKRKIQRKLYRIRLPYFMETLTLTTIDLGTNAPQFLNVVSHRLDSYGLSIDFDMSYSGGLTMTFETKLNLLKIKTDNSSSRCEANTTVGSLPNTSSSSTYQSDNPTASQDKQANSHETQSKDSTVSTNDPGSVENFQRESNPAIIKPQVSSSSASVRTSGGSSTSDSEDDDSDSSSDSSFEEADINEISDWEDYGAEKTRQNIVKFVDKIASSRYFQHATENRYIKKKLQDISNCPLVLVVQIQSLNGILTLNVPPPQTDRIWYGFKPTPELILKALPRMGDREVNLSHVTDWIERKLAEEFRKILVIPNMEDIVLPVLKSDHLQYVTATK